VGRLGPKKFWGCGIIVRQIPRNNVSGIATTNASMVQDLKLSVSDQHQILNFTDSDKIQYAIIAPPNVGTSQDWKASSFGVSTTCSAIPENACDLSTPTGDATDAKGNPIILVPFVCKRNRTGIDISGNLTSAATKTHLLNFHKYAAESAPFGDDSIDIRGGSMADIMASIQNEDANDIFKNPWQALVMKKVPFGLDGSLVDLPTSFRTDSRVWKHDQLGPLTLMLCNVTGKLSGSSASS
jgi:hypothetical protein